MTVIAWDGKTLAADKMFCHGVTFTKGTKIKKINGHLVFSSGDFDAIQSLFSWYERGAKPEEWPNHQKNEDRWVPLFVIKNDGVINVYNRDPYSWEIEDKIYAIGSGGDFALAAMTMGKTAYEAVELACSLTIDCGCGIDVLTLGDN